MPAVEKPIKKSSNEKQTVLEEINGVNSKCADLQETSESRDEEFVLRVKRAEKNNDMNLVVKPNTLKRSSNKAQNELKKLQESSGHL